MCRARCLHVHNHRVVLLLLPRSPLLKPPNSAGRYEVSNRGAKRLHPRSGQNIFDVEPSPILLLKRLELIRVNLMTQIIFRLCFIVIR